MAQAKALFTHCEQVYKEMVATAEATEAGDLIYTGFTTKLFKRLGLSVPYYSQVLTELKRMGCIQQIKRGGGSAPSIWLLIGEPDEKSFESLPEISRYALGGRKIQVEFDQRIRNLEERLAKAGL